MRVRMASGLIVLFAVPVIGAQEAASRTVTGVLTDTLCGARGANHLHAEHARRSVASGQAKYALYVSDAAPTARGASPAGQLYILESGQGTVSSGQVNLDQLFARYAGQRIRVTGTVTVTPIRRAGHSLAPDAVATTRNASGAQAPVSGNASRTGSGQVDTSPRVQQHRKALETTTPVAGVLTIAAVAPAPR